MGKTEELGKNVVILFCCKKSMMFTWRKVGSQKGTFFWNLAHSNLAVRGLLSSVTVKNDFIELCPRGVVILY